MTSITPEIHYPYLLSIHIEMNELGNRLSERIMNYTLNSPTIKLYMNYDVAKLMKSHHMRYSMNKSDPFLNKDELEDIELSESLDAIALSVGIKRITYGTRTLDKVIFKILKNKVKNDSFKSIDDFLDVHSRIEHLIKFIYDNKRLNECNDVEEQWIISGDVDQDNELTRHSVIIHAVSGDQTL